jgi:hypothetical protein
MGKWTPQYYDDVLANKFKTLVCTVLEEEQQQKRDQSDESDSSETAYRELTYESFVHSLARGENDDFLKPVVELLVKEFIDRQQKPGIASKRNHISLRTADSLRTLLGYDGYRTSHIRSYRGNAHEEWGADFQPPPLDTMDDPSLGTDFYSPAYDTYFPSTLASLSIPTRPAPIEPVIPRWHFETLGGLPPLRRSSTQGFSRSGSSELTRQSSIRRHNRSRMVDFTEFASRRRANGRTTLVEAETADSSPEPQPYAPDSENEAGSAYHGLVNSLSARSNTGFDPVRDAVTRDMLEGPVVEVHQSSTSQSSRHSAPRLRRGGVRAPEMAFVPSPLASAEWVSPEPPAAFSPRDVYEPPIRRFPSYLTPRSSSPEPSLNGSRLS